MNQRRDRHVLTHDDFVAAGRTGVPQLVPTHQFNSFQLISSKRVEQVTIRLIVVEESDIRGELGAFAADCMGDTMQAMAEDYLRLVALIEDGPIEDVPGIVFDCVESA